VALRMVFRVIPIALGAAVGLRAIVRIVPRMAVRIVPRMALRMVSTEVVTIAVLGNVWPILIIVQQVLKRGNDLVSPDVGEGDNCVVILLDLVEHSNRL